MPVGAFCAFLGFCRLVRYFTLFLGHAGRGYNIFVYGEVNDKDQPTLMGHTCFDTMRSYRSGIRFGGRFGEQKIFSFENIPYQNQDRSMKPGLGVIPTDNRDSRLIQVVIPMS